MGIFDSIGDWVSSAAETVADTATDAANTVADKATDAANTVADKTTDAANTVADKSTDVANTVADKTSDAANTVANTAVDVVNAVGDAIAKPYPDVTPRIEAIPGSPALSAQGSAALTGFDMVWAISENAVNSQLAWLQESGLIPHAVSFGTLEDQGLVIGGSGEDEALISPPTVHFNSGDAKSARLAISFTGGTISYYSNFGVAATVKKLPIAGWKLVFKVRLNLAQIAHDYLVHGDGKIPSGIQQILSQFDPGQFSVQSIFLDFENSDLTSYDAAESVIALDPAASLSSDQAFLLKVFPTSVGSWISGHKGSDNPFILGYPVTRLAPPQEHAALLEPTGANLSVHGYAGDQARAGLSTLNFLLVTGQRKIGDEPRLYGPDAGLFQRNLLEDPGSDGKAIIARGAFVNQYLRPLIIDLLEEKANALPDYLRARDDRAPKTHICLRTGIAQGQPADQQRARFALMSRTGLEAALANYATPLKGWYQECLQADLSGPETGGEAGAPWLYTDYVKLGWHESGSFSHDRETEQELGYTLRLSSQPDAAGLLRPTLDIHGALYRREYDRQNADTGIKSNVYVGDGWATAMMSWSIRLQFSAGSDGRISISQSSSQTEPATDHGDGGTFRVGDFFTDLLKLHGINDDWRNNAAGLASLESGLVQQLLAQTGPMIDNAMHQIVMPARSQFLYKNIQLNADGDIELDFSYRAA